MCTLITSKGTDIDENFANQNHSTCTRTPKLGYLKLTNIFHWPDMTIAFVFRTMNCFVL